MKDQVKRLEAGLCAIITELEKKVIANEVISQASKSGLINLMEFWENHSKEDEARLAKKFHFIKRKYDVRLSNIVGSHWYECDSIIRISENRLQLKNNEDSTYYIDITVPQNVIVRVYLK